MLPAACAGQGSITAPGSVGATPVESPIDIEEGLPVEVPLVYFFGSPSPTDNLALYRYIVERLAAVLNKRASLSPPVRLTSAFTCSALVILAASCCEDSELPGPARQPVAPHEAHGLCHPQWAICAAQGQVKTAPCTGSIAAVPMLGLET